MKFACIAFVVGIGLLNAVMGIRQILKLLRKKVASCEGKIIASTIGERDEWHGGIQKLRMCWPEVEYSYEVFGHELRGNQISYARWSTSKRAAVLDFLKRYPVGTMTTVFYNTDDPAESYLTNPRKHVATTAAIITAILLIATFLSIFLWRMIE